MTIFCTPGMQIDEIDDKIKLFYLCQIHGRKFVQMEEVYIAKCQTNC